MNSKYLVLLLLFLFVSPAYAWVNTSWPYRKNVTIDASQINGSLTNFPFLVRINNDSQLSTSLQGDGDDLLFATSSDVLLSHEIEWFNASTGSLLAWVRVPNMTNASGNIVLSMYYGNASVSSQQNASGVWDQNYLLVYHLNDNTSTTKIIDSTAYRKNGTAVANSNSTRRNGSIGFGTGFGGATDRILTNVTQALGNFTAQLWYNDTGSTVASTRLMDKKYDTGMYLGSDSAGGASSWGGGVLQSVSPYGNFTALTDGTFHSLVMSRNGTTKIIIGDGGARVNRTEVSGSALDTSEIKIGVDNVGTAFWFTGVMDELRVSNISRSEAWLMTEYNNQKVSANMTSVSSQELYAVENPSSSIVFLSGVGALSFSGIGRLVMPG